MVTIILLSIFIVLVLLYILIQNFKITNKISATQFEDIVIAHRGYRALYPENTLEAMEQAHLAGADGVEFDLRLSKDGIPVVIHDRKVERTTDGGGKVHELTYDEIKKLKARFKRKLYNFKIPTLYDAITLIKLHKLKANIEIKNSKNSKVLIKSVAGAIKKYNLYNQVYVSSFNFFYLYRLRKIDPNIITALNIHHKIKGSKFISKLYRFLLVDFLISFLNVSILAPNYVMVDKKFIKKYKDKSIVLIPYTVNYVRVKKFLKKNKISYITDRVI